MSKQFALDGDMLRVQAACKAGMVPFLIGAPGLGKTASVKALAEATGRQLIILLGSTMDPTDMTGMPSITTDAKGRRVTEYGMPSFMKRVYDAFDAGQDSIIFLDEVTTVPAAVQNALLTFVQERCTPAGDYLPESTWMIMAGNAVEHTAEGTDLAAPMANRLMHIPFNPSVTEWTRDNATNWGRPCGSEAEKQVRVTVSAFIDQYPESLYELPPNPVDQSGAWPSRRSWDNACKVLGELGGFKHPEAQTALSQIVGVRAAGTFAVWLDNVKLPRPEEVLRNPQELDWDAMDAPRVYGILRSCAYYDAPFNQVIGLYLALADTTHKDVALAVFDAVTLPLLEESSLPMEEKLEMARKVQGAFGEMVANAGVF